MTSIVVAINKTLVAIDLVKDIVLDEAEVPEDDVAKDLFKDVGLAEVVEPSPSLNFTRLEGVELCKVDGLNL